MKMLLTSVILLTGCTVGGSPVQGVLKENTASTNLSAAPVREFNLLIQKEERKVSSGSGVKYIDLVNRVVAGKRDLTLINFEVAGETFDNSDTEGIKAFNEEGQGILAALKGSEVQSDELVYTFDKGFTVKGGDGRATVVYHFPASDLNIKLKAGTSTVITFRIPEGETVLLEKLRRYRALNYLVDETQERLSAAS